MNILALPLMVTAVASVSTDRPPHTLVSAPQPIVESSSAGTPRELTVLTYNVHGLPWPLAKGRKQDFRRIGETLGRMRAEGRAPDIVLIQEGFESIDELVRLSGYQHWTRGPLKDMRPDPDHAPGSGGFARVRYRTRGEGWGKLTSSGLHVLSDYPIMTIEDTVYSYCAGWDCLANKGVMLVRVAIPGLPDGVDLATTHLNSKKSAAVPSARSLVAHHLQLEEMTTFIESKRSPGAPLIVGGDFNVRHAAQRYYHRAAGRPFTVVSEYCKRSHGACDSGPPLDMDEPWLESEDLQAFADGSRATVRPKAVRMVFDDQEGARLSDHDGYLVRYELRAAPSSPRYNMQVAEPSSQNTPTVSIKGVPNTQNTPWVSHGALRPIRIGGRAD